MRDPLGPEIALLASEPVQRPVGHDDTLTFELAVDVRHLRPCTGHQYPPAGRRRVCDARPQRCAAPAYDRVGNRTAVIQELDATGGKRTDAFVYDAANRLVDSVLGATSTDPAALTGLTSSGESNVRTRQVYDADGRVVGSYGRGRSPPVSPTRTSGS
jgi:hypothetical protein